MNGKIKLAGLILVGGLAWGGYEFYSFFNKDLPAIQIDLSTKQQAIDTKKNELGKLRSFATAITETKTRLKKTNQEFEDALEFIPRNLDLSKLLAKINLLARNSGIEIETFHPAKETTTKDLNNKDPGTSKMFFETVGLEVQLRGGFSQTVMFFDQVSRLKRILNVENLKMVPVNLEAGRGPSSSGTQLATTVLFRTYRFSE
jgi:type IV pilus assembly protein PilO